jgi:hypothetical protein
VERPRESFLIGAASAAPRSIDHYRIPAPPPVLWLLHASITLKLEDRRYVQMAAKVFHRPFVTVRVEDNTLVEDLEPGQERSI